MARWFLFFCQSILLICCILWTYICFFIKNSIKNLICKNSNLILVSAYTSRLRKGMVIYMTTPILPHNHGDIHNVLEAMPSKDTCADMASAFKQLCDGTRLQIFWLLCHSEECVLNISAAECSRCLPSPALSKRCRADHRKSTWKGSTLSHCLHHTGRAPSSLCWQLSAYQLSRWIWQSGNFALTDWTFSAWILFMRLLTFWQLIIGGFSWPFYLKIQ